jgi:hypothetical protein
MQSVSAIRKTAADAAPAGVHPIAVGEDEQDAEEAIVGFGGEAEGQQQSGRAVFKVIDHDVMIRASDGTSLFCRPHKAGGELQAQRDVIQGARGFAWPFDREAFTIGTVLFSVATLLAAACFGGPKHENTRRVVLAGGKFFRIFPVFQHRRSPRCEERLR